jgi:hypothetical protein
MLSRDFRPTLAYSFLTADGRVTPHSIAFDRAGRPLTPTEELPTLVAMILLQER